MFGLGWIVIKFVPGGIIVTGTAMNAAIHVIMYGYYYIASLGPEYRKYLWWKKHLTQLQIVQFLINLRTSFKVIYAPNSCEYYDWMPPVMFFYNMTFLVLFANFFIRTYYLNKDKKVQEKGKRPNSNGVNNHANGVEENSKTK